MFLFPPQLEPVGISENSSCLPQNTLFRHIRSEHAIHTLTFSTAIAVTVVLVPKTQYYSIIASVIRSTLTLLGLRPKTQTPKP